MNKESLDQRIAFQKQQLQNAENAEIARQKTQKLIDDESRRLAEINEQNKVDERITKTKETFKGSGIIETLEEIRDKQILVYETIRKTRLERMFFREEKVNYNEIVPAKIFYDLNVVKLDYDHWHEPSQDYGWGGPSSGESKLIIEKIDDTNFKFGNNPEMIGNAQVMIDNIAWVIAVKQMKK